MYNIKVTFGNGETWSPDTRVQFKDDTRSRTIDLPGEARQIKTIDFHYKSRLNRGKATITVHGRRAKGGTGGGGGMPNVGGGDWELLGSREVAFGGDKDTINCAGEGRFTSFKIEVEEGDLSPYDLVVVFGNGDKESPKTRLEFDDNTRSRDIDRPGKARNIKSITFFYKSNRGGREGKAVVHVYGKK